ncbi:MAG: hypothetical protein MJ168_08080 [Clostridia bacterium]|nr:hypothetical protein [Clostridia bacterium]
MSINAGGDASYQTQLKFENEISDALKNANRKATTVCLMYATTKAPQYRAYMQSHRPWTDRTGAAKQRLNVQASKDDANTITLTFSQGVSYGIWLELAHEKKYEVIMPSINALSTQYFTGISEVFEKIFEQ